MKKREIVSKSPFFSMKENFSAKVQNHKKAYLQAFDKDCFLHCIFFERFCG